MERVLEDLRHIRRRFRLFGLPAQVIVLNTGALVGPDGEAMLQALHSRSIGGFDHHFAEFLKRGAEKFIRSAYIGYGHQSIGDCGSVTVFIEGVSMLAAKAIQDSRLYSGQEASTRYIDFSTQPFMVTNGDSSLVELLRETYLSVRSALPEHLIRQYAPAPDESDQKFAKNIEKRTFDIARCLLPAGAVTNLAWHSSIRQANDHLAYLRHHPLAEVRMIARKIEDALADAWPSSFPAKRYPETEAYNRRYMRTLYYYEQPDDYYPRAFRVTADHVDRALLATYRPAILKRPPHTELPRAIEECGTLQCEFGLDFASFRDIQRHRGVVQRMPLLTTRHGFEPWYLAQMPESMAHGVRCALETVTEAIRYGRLGELPPAEQQYHIPMGFVLPNRITGGLHALAYLAERRAQNDVHPTLEFKAHDLANELRKRFGMPIYTSDEPGRFSRKRADQDIRLAS
ncbi:MAG TPA: FAD-dependent thymidylate synthase [Candidatus Paceibacterota bacterium]|nr:FAD-dependent thymidylate synthase [Candidatus Paceibacterota bacterium]